MKKTVYTILEWIGVIISLFGLYLVRYEDINYDGFFVFGGALFTFVFYLLEKREEKNSN